MSYNPVGLRYKKDYSILAKRRKHVSINKMVDCVDPGANKVKNEGIKNINKLFMFHSFSINSCPATS